MESYSRTNSKYSVGEHVDCLNKIGTWCNAEVLKVTKDSIRVHYSCYSSVFDETIPLNSERVQKQWKRGMKLSKNNRVDVWDGKLWREAIVKDAKSSGDIVVIGYRGISQIYNE